MDLCRKAKICELNSEFLFRVKFRFKHANLIHQMDKYPLGILPTC